MYLLRRGRRFIRKGGDIMGIIYRLAYLCMNIYRYADLWIIPVIFSLFRINRRSRRNNWIQYLKGIDKGKRAVSIIGNTDIGIAGLNIRKESKFLDRRINRIRLIFFIAYIDRFLIFIYSKISIYSNASIWFYNNFWIPNVVSD
jgi:hypothetical protein